MRTDLGSAEFVPDPLRWRALSLCLVGIPPGARHRRGFPHASGVRVHPDVVRGPERGKAFGFFGATIGVSTAIGPLLGGALVEMGGMESGWRWVFYVNVPVGLVALALVPRLLPVSEKGPKQSLDPVGVLIFGAAVLCLLFPLVSVEGGTLSQRPWWLVAVAAGILAGFVGWERRWFRRGKALSRLPSDVPGALPCGDWPVMHHRARNRGALLANRAAE